MLDVTASEFIGDLDTQAIDRTARHDAMMTIGGVPHLIEFKSLKIAGHEDRVPLFVGDTPVGSFDVTGNLTAYYYDTAVLEEYAKADWALQQYLYFLLTPQKPPLWKRLLRGAAWVAAGLVLLLLAKGAY